MLGHMCWPCEHFPLQKTIQSTIRDNILGHMCRPREHFPLQKKQHEVHFGATYWVICVGRANTFPGKKTIRSTLRSNIFGHICYTKYTSGQNLGSYVWATRALSLAKKTYNVHFGSTCLVIFVGPANTFPLPKSNAKYTSGQHIGSYAWATRALSLAKNNTKYTSEQHVWS